MAKKRMSIYLIKETSVLLAIGLLGGVVVGLGIPWQTSS